MSYRNILGLESVESDLMAMLKSDLNKKGNDAYDIQYVTTIDVGLRYADVENCGRFIPLLGLMKMQ